MMQRDTRRFVVEIAISKEGYFGRQATFGKYLLCVEFFRKALCFFCTHTSKTATRQTDKGAVNSLDRQWLLCQQLDDLMQDLITERAVTSAGDSFELDNAREDMLKRLSDLVDKYTFGLVLRNWVSSESDEKDVLLQDLDDFNSYLYAATLRHEEAMALQNRSVHEHESSTTIGGPSGIPLLILDEVMDILREQLIERTFRRNWRGAGVMKLQRHIERHDPEHKPLSIRRTLANCVLVHSSWSRRGSKRFGERPGDEKWYRNTSSDGLQPVRWSVDT